MLNISKNTNLIQLLCDHNELIALDISKNTALQALDCSYNQLSMLDTSKSVALVRLTCYANNLISITTSYTPSLNFVDVRFQNSITITLEEGQTEFDLSSLDSTIETSNIEGIVGATLSGTVLQSLVPGTDVVYSSNYTYNKGTKNDIMSVRIHVISENRWTTPLSISNWSYGEEASTPTAVSAYGVPTFVYSRSLTETFTSIIPDAVGKWYVKAIVEGINIYTGIESNVVQFEITENTNSYKVTFEDFDGNILKQDQLKYGSTIIAPANPTREGYTFAGWSPALDATVPGNDVTYKATYTVNTYKVTFEDFNGNILKQDQLKYGSAIMAPVNQTREGYTFAGWTPALDATVPMNDVTYKPIYHKNPELMKKSYIANVGEKFNEFVQIDVEGSIGSIIVKVVDSSLLPNGMKISENGEIIGIPTKVGVYEVMIGVDDAYGDHSDMRIKIEVKELVTPVEPEEPAKPTKPTTEWNNKSTSTEVVTIRSANDATTSNVSAVTKESNLATTKNDVEVKEQTDEKVIALKDKAVYVDENVDSNNYATNYGSVETALDATEKIELYVGGGLLAGSAFLLICILRKKSQQN